MFTYMKTIFLLRSYLLGFWPISWPILMTELLLNLNRQYSGQNNRITPSTFQHLQIFKKISQRFSFNDKLTTKLVSLKNPNTNTLLWRTLYNRFHLKLTKLVLFCNIKGKHIPYVYISLHFRTSDTSTNSMYMLISQYIYYLVQNNT